jgi:hypothetical protein
MDNRSKELFDAAFAAAAPQKSIQAAQTLH